MNDDMIHGAPAGDEPQPQRGETISGEELFSRLEGILTVEQLQSIWNAARGNRDAVTAELKTLLQPHAEVLEERGFVADYLAYMLPYVLGAHLEANRRVGPNAMWN